MIPEVYEIILLKTNKCLNALETLIIPNLQIRI